MTVIRCSLWAALVATAITAGGSFWLRQHRWRESRWLRGENSRLLQKLTTQVHGRSSPLPDQTFPSVPAAPPAIKESGENFPSAATDGDYRNEGNATPLAALQTIAWACDQGDVTTMMRLIRFDEAARVRVLDFMGEMPEETRIRWTTPERLAATLLVEAGMGNPFPSATVLQTASTETVSADRVKLHLSGTPRADSEYQLTPDGWKYAITTKSVEAYLARNQGR